MFNLFSPRAKIKEACDELFMASDKMIRDSFKQADKLHKQVDRIFAEHNSLTDMYYSSHTAETWITITLKNDSGTNYKTSIRVSSIVSVEEDADGCFIFWDDGYAIQRLRSPSPHAEILKILTTKSDA